MGEVEFLDFPGRTYHKKEANIKEDIFDEADAFTPGRKRVSDYKYAATPDKSNVFIPREEYAPEAERKMAQKTTINVSDEKIVWVGAIFVFFGVLVFLIGYWLGKSTMKDIAENGLNSSIRAEQQLNQSRVENAIGNPQSGLNDTARLPNPSGDLPKVSVVAPPASNTTAIKPAPAINKTDTSSQQASSVTVDTTKPTAVVLNRDDNKTGAVKITPVKTVKTQTVKAAPVIENSSGSGNYTLQVSAHTSLEKARFVEESLRNMNLEAYIVEATVNGTTYYRVRAGKFMNKADAEGTLARLHTSDLGKEGFVVNLN